MKCINIVFHYFETGEFKESDAVPYLKSHNGRENVSDFSRRFLIMLMRNASPNMEEN